MQDSFQAECPLGIATHLYGLTHGDNLDVVVRMHDSHPCPAHQIPGFARLHAEWMGKVESGLITNGVTLAPFSMRNLDTGQVVIDAVCEDYVTNRASSQAWSGLEPGLRQRTIGQMGFNPLYSRFMGTACAVVGADGMMVMARRSRRAATEPGYWAPAIGEGMDSADIGLDGTANVRGCIMRGAREELDLGLSPGDVERCLHLGSITLNAVLGEIVVNAVLDLRLAQDCCLDSNQVVSTALNGARDSWERDRYVVIPATHEALLMFADQHSHGPMSSYGLVTAGLALNLDNRMAPRAGPARRP